MTVNYREGAFSPVPRYVIGALFLVYLVIVVYFFATTLSHILAGSGLTRLETLGIPLLLIGVILTDLVVRVAGPSSIPIRVESGVVHFPKRGAFAVLFGYTVAIPTTHVAGVDVMWAEFPVRGGGRKWFLHKIVLKTLEGGSYSKAYGEYKPKEQAWGLETSAQLLRLFNSKVRNVVARTGQPLPVRS